MMFQLGLPGLRSTQRKPAARRGSGIGLNTRHIAAEVGLEPCVNRKIQASRDELLGSSPGFLNAARLLIGDHLGLGV
jgi:hypothetical protein